MHDLVLAKGFSKTYSMFWYNKHNSLLLYFSHFNAGIVWSCELISDDEDVYWSS